MEPNRPTDINRADYDFIFRQPTPSPSSKIPIKIILLLVVSILTAIVFVLSVVSEQKPKGRQVSTSTTSGVESVKSFIGAVQQEDLLAVRQSYAFTNQREDTYLNDFVIKPLQQYDLSSCTYRSLGFSSSNESDTVEMDCQLKNSLRRSVFQFDITTTPKGMKIADSRIVGTK